jgi:diacylglycerol kinase (ATP)
MKARFILNPQSGRNVRRTWLAPHILSFIASRRMNASLVFTKSRGHATELARTALAEGCDRVIAVGGDGTMNEVAQALVNSRVALGLVPCGSGNGLALHLGLPTALEHALHMAAASDTRMMEIDVGSANGHPFFNAMGLGFDADVSERFNRLTRRGLLAYAQTGLSAFRQRRSANVVITSGERRYQIPTLLVAVANSDQYGNNARIAPGARIDDGKLDLVAIPPVGVAGALRLVSRLFSGSLHADRGVLHLRHHAFSIERADAGLIHTDGETHHTSARVDVTIRPRGLRLLLPAASPAQRQPTPKTAGRPEVVAWHGVTSQVSPGLIPS